MTQGKTVLVIEDDQTTQALLCAAVRKAGARAVAALDGMQGVMLARQQNPDLIILDLQLPAGRGEMVFERIKMLVSTSGIPVLVYTSTPADQASQLIQDPSVEFLQKPLPPDQLVDVIRRKLNPDANPSS